MTTTKTPRAAKTPRVSRETKALAAAQALAASVLAAMPTKEQLDREQAEAEAQEAANLAAEAAEQAAEVVKPEGYSGPMLALRERLLQGAYKKMPNGQPANGDQVATALGSLTPAQVISACIAAMALPSNPYLHLNIGQQSMNLRNKLRGCLKRGEFGFGVVREAIEDVQQITDQADAAEFKADKAE